MEKKYENLKTQAKNGSGDNLEKIKDKYNKLKEKNEKTYKEKVILNKFKNDCKRMELIKKNNYISSLIAINEIIKRIQEKYIDNYFNNNNLINVLISFSKSEDDEIKQLFLNNNNYNNHNNSKKNEIISNNYLFDSSLASKENKT